MWKLLNKENPISLQNKFTFVYVMKKIGMIPKYCLPYSAEELWLEVFLITRFQIMKLRNMNQNQNHATGTIQSFY